MEKKMQESSDLKVKFFWLLDFIDLYMTATF